MESSGFDQGWMSSTAVNFNGTPMDFLDPKSPDMEFDNVVILFVILAVCVTILFLLVFVSICYYKNSISNHGKNTSNVRTILLSKSTSITGLNNCERDHNTHVENTWTTAKLDLTSGSSMLPKSHKNKFFVHNDNSIYGKPLLTKTPVQLMTSTPTLKELFHRNETANEAALFSPQSAIAEKEPKQLNNENNDSTSINFSNNSAKLTTINDTGIVVNIASTSEFDPDTTSVSDTMSPVLKESTEWVTARDSIDAKFDRRSSMLYNTDLYYLQDIGTKEATGDRSFDYDCNKAPENLSLLPLCDLESNKCFSDTASEQSPLSPSRVTTSLPLDAYGHPRAWFVPLDEIYREPLRHSFIDVVNHNSTLEGKINEDVFDHPRETQNADSQEADTDECDVDSASYFTSSKSTSAISDTSGTSKKFILNRKWENSRIPRSQFSLRKFESSDVNNKKPSRWEQREDRPVVFLEDTCHLSTSTDD